MLMELSDITDDDYRELYVWRHPRLLDPGVADRLAAQVKARPRHGRAPLSAALRYLRGFVQRSGSPPRYRIGAGPVEEVWQRVASGEISAAEGERLVRAPAFCAALSAHYLRFLSRWLRAQALDGAGRQAVAAARLLRAAAAAPDCRAASAELLVWITVNLVDIATLALHEAPSLPLLTEAQSAGESELAALGPDGGQELRAALLHALGVLFLDPYFSGVTSDHVQEQLASWGSRESLAVDPTQDVTDRGMPEPLTALGTAEGYLRRSLALWPAGRRAPTAKALVEVLGWRSELGDNIDTGEIGRLCRDALAELDEHEDLPIRISLLSRLQYDGEPVDASAAAPVLDCPATDLAAQHGTEGAAIIVLTAARLVLPTAPRMALDAVKRSRELLADSGENLRMAALELELTALADAIAPPLPERNSVAASVAELNSRAQGEGWNGAARAAAMLRLAGRASNTDEESLGLQLLDQIRETSPIVNAEHAELLDMLRVSLQLNMGVNAFRAQQWAECAGWYARALTGWLDLGFDDRALDTLMRVGDIAFNADTPVHEELLLALAPNTARIETRLGDGATELIQEFVREALRSVQDRPVSPEWLFLLWQIAKGARLAPVLAAGRGYDLAADEYGRRLLEMINQLRAELSVVPGAAQADQDTLLDEETVLGAYARHREVQGGATPREQLANLEHAYDEHLTRQLLRETGGDWEAAFAGLDEIRARLGNRTVLLSIYLGAGSDGRVAVYMLFVTSDDAGMTMIPHEFPSSMVDIGGALTNPFGLLVESVRKEVQDPPLGRRLVSREAEGTLQGLLPGLLGHVSERLTELKATGHDHLCIVPHGPFHFFPFHLLGAPGHPLAEEFAVTYLPHLRVLAGPRDEADGRPLAMSAIGIGFDGDRRQGLHPLPTAVPESREIAGFFGRQAIVDSQATEAAVVAALQDSRVVHLATHGRHNVNAPAFQTLYTYKAAGSDGMLHAYELLGRSLRGLRLLTLSACETALGRFDLGDNIRGLPASFFICGVATIIGTLWPVRDDVSRHFFVAFYRVYAAGTPLLDAFVAAQRDTRQHFPQYRDWGAFYFTGNWADGDAGQKGDNDHL